MAFSIAFILVVASAVGAVFSTPRSRPRLPRVARAMATLLPLLAAMLVLGDAVSAFGALVSVLTMWMIALPVVGALRAWLAIHRGDAHG